MFEVAIASEIFFNKMAENAAQSFIQNHQELITNSKPIDTLSQKDVQRIIHEVLYKE